MGRRAKADNISLTSLKEKAWTAFSRFIRLRDSDEYGYCVCCTCPTRLPWREMTAGHFVSGRGNAVLFDERVVHAQCVRCNVFNGGEYARYFLFMRRKYGLSDSQIEELLNLKHKIVKRTEHDLICLADEFDRKADELEAARNRMDLAGACMVAL